MSEEFRRDRFVGALMSSKLHFYFLADEAGQYAMNLPTHDGFGVRPHQCAVHALVFAGMREHGETEADNPFAGFAWKRRCSSLHGLQQGLQLSKSADEQLILIAEVQIKGGATHIGSVEYLLHRYGLILLLQNARHQGLVQQPASSLYTTIWCFLHHLASPHAGSRTNRPVLFINEQLASRCSSPDLCKPVFS